MEKESCTSNDCRHEAELRKIKSTIRKITHDLSQPIMLLQVHYELLELEKCSFERDSSDRFLDIISRQMDIFQDLHARLRKLIVHSIR